MDLCRRAAHVGTLALLCVSVAPSGCRSSKPSVSVADAGLSGTAPLDALSRRLGRVRARLRNHGFRESTPVTRVFVLENEGVSMPLALPAQRCTTFVGLGGGELRDLRLSLFDAQGVLASEDGVRAEGGLVHVCPEGPADQRSSYYLTIEAREGTGAVALSAFESSPGRELGFDGLFHDVLAPNVRFRRLEADLARARMAFRARGFVPSGPVKTQSLAEGEALRTGTHMDAGRCYTAVVRAGPKLRDIDLVLFNATGAEVARDRESNAAPVLHFCPEESGAYSVEARAFEGADEIGLLVLVGGGRSKPKTAVPEPLDEPAHTSPPLGGDPVESLSKAVARLTERGYGPPRFVERAATLAPGEVRLHEVALGAGCAVVLGAADRAETDIDVYLSDSTGRSLDQDTGVQATARVSGCASEDRIVRVAVKGYGASGHYALAVLRAPSGMHDVAELRLDEASAAFRARGYVVRALGSVSLAEGEAIERSVEVSPNSCAALSVAGDAPVEDVDLFLYDESGRLLAGESGPLPYAAVSACSASRQKLRAELRMYRGAGVVRLQRLVGPLTAPAKGLTRTR